MPRRKPSKGIREAAPKRARATKGSSSSSRTAVAGHHGGLLTNTPGPSNHDITDIISANDNQKPKFWRAAIDWGTANTSVACQMFDADAQASDAHIFTVEFTEHKEVEIPAVMAYDDDGVLHEGFEVVDRLEDGVWTEKDVLRNVKSALEHYSNNTSSILYEKVRQHCARVGKTVEDLVNDYVSLIVQRTFEALSKDQRYRNISDVPFELILTMPTSWPPKYNILLAEAGMKAGASKTWCAHEGICAAVTALLGEVKHDQGRNLPQLLQPGKVAATCDMGGGTCEFSVVRILSAISEANFQCELVRPLTGASAGAQMVNQNFRTWFEKVWSVSEHGENLVELSTSLGFDNVDDFLDQCAVQFEQCKRAFPRIKNHYITIRGRSKGSRSGWFMPKPMTETTMKSFFDPVINAIISLVQNSIKDVAGLEMIILCGGLASSSYVVERLEEAFPDVYVLKPRKSYEANVVTGALKRYSRNISHPMGSCWSFFVPRDEPWTPEHHPDATQERKKRPKPDMTFICLFDGTTRLVYDRCNYFVDGVNKTVRLVWIDNVLDWHGDHTPITLRYDVYWTIKPEVRDSEPLYKVNDDGTKQLRDGFYEYHTVERTILDPSAAGIRKVYQPATGLTTWEVISCLVPRFNQDNIQLAIVLRDEENTFNKLNQSFSTYAVPWEVPEELWTTIYNPDCSHLGQEFASAAPTLMQTQSSTLANAPPTLLTNELEASTMSNEVDAGDNAEPAPTRLSPNQVPTMSNEHDAIDNAGPSHARVLTDNASAVGENDPADNAGGSPVRPFHRRYSQSNCSVSTIDCDSYERSVRLAAQAERVVKYGISTRNTRR